MSEDIKNVIGELGSTFEEFKKSNDERLAQIETKGTADPILEDKINKMNDAISNLDSVKGDIEKLQTAAARKSKNIAAGGVDLEAKAAEFESLCSKNRGMRPEGNFTNDDLNAYKASFRQWMRKGDLVSLDHQKALSVGTDADGGYVVDPDTSGSIVTQIYETSPMRQYAAQQTIGTNELKGMHDLGEANSGWVAETAARTETGTPQLAPYTIPVFELYANPAATQSVLDDSYMNLESWLAGKVSDKFARDENAAFINGDGTTQPKGILTYPAGTTLPTQIEQINSGVSGGFAAAPASGDVLLDTVFALKKAYRANATWGMNRSLVSTVRKMKDSNGDYLWQAGLQNGTPSSLAGFGIAEFEDMPDLAADSLSVLFGDLRQAYQIVDRAGVRVLRDPYTNKPYIHFYTTKRVGGDVVNFEAVKIIAASV